MGELSDFLIISVVVAIDFIGHHVITIRTVLYRNSDYVRLHPPRKLERYLIISERCE